MSSLHKARVVMSSQAGFNGWMIFIYWMLSLKKTKQSGVCFITQWASVCDPSWPVRAHCHETFPLVFGGVFFNQGEVKIKGSAHSFGGDQMFMQMCGQFDGLPFLNPCFWGVKIDQSVV